MTAIGQKRTFDFILHQMTDRENLGNTYRRLHFRLLSFGVRRIVAPGFVFVGLFIAGTNLPSVLPGGTTLVNGVSEDDIVMRWSSVVLPLLIAVLGVALYRAKPIARLDDKGS